jgi:hypothetical protein
MGRFLKTVAGTAAAALACAGTALGAAPESKSAPTISGTPIVGKTLTASTGLWRNSPTSFKYQWMRCDAKGNNCASIAGATEKEYDLVEKDVGHTMLVLVTASNSDGSQTANSHPTAVVTKAVAPSSKTAPSITGKPVVGAQLVADVGTYGGGAVEKYLFQWRRCDSAGGNCSDISGATKQTYIVTGADVGKTLRVSVTARNDYGSTTNESKASAVVQSNIVAVTTTIAASKATTICCQKITLSGHVSSNKAGEPITILAQEFDETVTDVVARTTTDASGNWSARVTPLIRTTYAAQTSTNKSAVIVANVHPRMGFGISGNNFSAKITGRGTFAGAIALFQVLSPAGQWQTKAIIVVNQFSVAKFHVALKRGRTYTVRIYLPQRQAGPGYLDGVSHVRRVGGTA